MSVAMTSMVMQHYPGAGALYTLALCLADSANAHGESIFPSVGRLALYSRQSARNVQRQLRRLEDSGWLVCVERSAGGRGNPSRYRIDPEWIADPVAWAEKRGLQCPAQAADVDDPGDRKPRQIVGVTDDKPRQNVAVSDSETTTNRAGNHDTAVSPEQKQQHLINPVRPISENPGSAEPSAGTDVDLDLAKGMFDLVLQLHPNHKPPNWRRWCRELRLMRERDGRSPQQIAVLFRWANGHRFWAANILSPGKLREQWDKLVIQRKAEGGQLGAGEYTPPDRRCVRCADGTLGSRLVPGVGHLCNHHIDELEGLHA